METNHSHQNIILSSEQTQWARQAAEILDIEVMEMLSQLLKSNLEALGENTINAKLPENNRKMV